MKVTPIALNPNLVFLNASGSFPGQTVMESTTYGVCGSFQTPNGNLHLFGPTVNYQPRLYQSTVSVGIVFIDLLEHRCRSYGLHDQRLEPIFR